MDHLYHRALDYFLAFLSKDAAPTVDPASSSSSSSSSSAAAAVGDKLSKYPGECCFLGSVEGLELLVPAAAPGGTPRRLTVDVGVRSKCFPNRGLCEVHGFFLCVFS